jgi:hypothetical protein
MIDPRGTKQVSSEAEINAENVVSMAMEDLLGKDQNGLERELQRELKEVMVEWRQKKLACL